MLVKGTERKEVEVDVKISEVLERLIEEYWYTATKNNKLSEEECKAMQCIKYLYDLEKKKEELEKIGEIVNPILLKQIQYEDLLLDIYATQYQSDSSLAIISTNSENGELYEIVSINLQDYDISYDKQKQFVFSHNISMELRDIIFLAICEDEYSRFVKYGCNDSIIVKLNTECLNKLKKA